MKKNREYSADQRAQALQQVSSRGDRTIEEVAEACGVVVGTLKAWMKEAKRKSSAIGSSRAASAYSPTDQLNTLIETAHMDQQALATWCRSKGLFPHQLQVWRQALTAPRSDESQALRDVRRQRDSALRELQRKEKALAEAAALLVLQKKFHAALSGEES